MKYAAFLALPVIAATSVAAEDTRQLDAHEHGVGQLDIAFEGSEIAMEFHAPGADIVGFEYPAESAEDRAAIENALSILAQPLELFRLPDAADCQVVSAEAELEGDEGHEEDHDDHDHEDHAHDDDHDEHEHEAGHTEFHAEYRLTCGDPTAVTDITFSYFDSFPNALEIEVQAVSDTGATSFEVERDAPVLDLRGVF